MGSYRSRVQRFVATMTWMCQVVLRLLGVLSLLSLLSLLRLRFVVVLPQSISEATLHRFNLAH